MCRSRPQSLARYGTRGVEVRVARGQASLAQRASRTGRRHENSFYAKARNDVTTSLDKDLGDHPWVGDAVVGERPVAVEGDGHGLARWHLASIERFVLGRGGVNHRP